MSVLRSDFEAALHDLLAACRAAGDGHAQAAEVVGDETIAGRLRALAERRGATADALAEQVRRLGDVPAAPPGEQSLLKDVVARTKALIADDERVELLGERIEAEERLLDCAAAALKAGPEKEQDGALLEQLRGLHEDCTRTLRALNALRVDLKARS